LKPGLWTSKRFLRASWLLLMLAGCLATLSFGSPARAEDLYQTAQESVDKYAGQLAALAEWCDQRGLAEQARKTRSWVRPDDPSRVRVMVLPREVGGSGLPADSPADVVEWRNRLTRLKHDQANAMFALARRAMVVHRASLAFDLLMAALRENPDHDSIRRILGYQEYRGQWCTRFEVDMLRSGHVRHEKFGWLPRTRVKRYQQGQRYHRGRWIPAEEDAKLHSHINSGWDVETEHYAIRTNHSLEAGVELGRQLERLYRVWKQLFIRFYATEDQVAALFAGPKRGGRPIALRQRHSVVYFRDREDYNRSLLPTLPNIEISVGVYIDSARYIDKTRYIDRTGRAYFFAGEDYDQRTLYHEATHQLFHESGRMRRDVGKDHNFWIIEGIAMYMESLREEDGYYVLGGFDDVRMEDAQFRLLNDDFYVPLSEFTGYGVDQLQHDERIATLYTQAAGLTHFLIHYDHGRYRDALVAYLAAVYSGQADLNTLARLTATPYSELDRQYREFMERGVQRATSE